MDFSNMTPEEIYELMKQLEKELAARQNREALTRDINNVLLTARVNGAAYQPDPEWTGTPPIDESYAVGETTVKDGVGYTSVIPNNVCVPGECLTGWKKQEPDAS